MKTTTPLACRHHESPLGTMLLAATDRGLAGLWFLGQRHGPTAAPGLEVADHPVLQETVRQLSAYFAGERGAFALPIDFAWGTPFQRSVWQALLAIPAGETTSYAALGRRVGRPSAARAIGAAVGRNPVSIVVPCHRVLGTAGALTGYAGGIERKAALLRLEGALV